jgi:hypothetical protein
MQPSAWAFRDHRSDCVRTSTGGQDPGPPGGVKHGRQTADAFGHVNTALRIVGDIDLLSGIVTNLIALHLSVSDMALGEEPIDLLQDVRLPRCN